MGFRLSGVIGTLLKTYELIANINATGILDMISPAFYWVADSLCVVPTTHCQFDHPYVTAGTIQEGAHDCRRHDPALTPKADGNARAFV